MELKKRILWACICCFTVLCVQAQQTPAILQRGGAQTPACEQWVEAQLEKMSLKEKIGQLFIHTVAPLNTQDTRNNLTRAIRDYKIGGLLFSGGTVPNQVALTNFAQEKAKIPLMITFDGEWGLAMRMKNTINFQRNRVLGCIQDNQLLYEYGREMARQCKEMGIHVNFAPVADVDVNPKNPVINTRSFGSNPKNVADKVIAYSQGLEEGGVLSVSKHFPGHGDTDVDSHKALPVLTFDRARLDSIELYPFRQMIAAGLGGVMVGHLEVPALDKLPASLSPEIVDGLLKQELGFQGLAFTDALEMQGVAQYGNLSVKALKAGNDLLLVQRNLKRELASVVAAVKAGELSEELITAKCRKVLTYKYALGLSQKPHIMLSGLQERLNSPEAKKLLRRLQKAAVTVVSNQGQQLPLDTQVKGTTLLQIGNPGSGVDFYNQLKKSMQVTRVTITPATQSAVKQQLLKSQRVIVTVTAKSVAPYEAMLNEVAAKVPVIYVHLNAISKMNSFESVWSKAAGVVLVHTTATEVQRHAADVMQGKAVADGRLSVSVGHLFKAGDGVTLSAATQRTYVASDYGMSDAKMHKIDEIALEGIKSNAYPGCQIVILKDGKPIYDKCFGTLKYGSSEKVTPDHLYDLASLTKTTATLLAVMKLYDEGKFGLTDRIGQYVPALKGTDKARITISELLFHQSGLQPYYPFYRNTIDDKSYSGQLYRSRRDANHRRRIDTRLYVANHFEFKKHLVADSLKEPFTLQVADGIYVHQAFRDSILQKIVELPLRSRTYRYSCLNFVLLKEMVEGIVKMPMDEYLERTFYGPMGLKRTLYKPLTRYQKKEVAPTLKDDYLRNGELRGYVHDEIAAFLGGVSGNAGLFSTARDVAQVYQMLIDGGEYQGKRYLTPSTCELFMNHTSRISRRALGFDKPDVRNPQRSPCAEEAPKEVIGHTGFTGTCAWADPKNRLVYVFICNRTYPQPYNHKSLMTLDIRPRIQQAMYQAVIR